MSSTRRSGAGSSKRPPPPGRLGDDSDEEETGLNLVAAKMKSSKMARYEEKSNSTNTKKGEREVFAKEPLQLSNSESEEEDELFGTPVEEEDDSLATGKKEELQMLFSKPPPRMKATRRYTPQSALQYKGPGIKITRMEPKREQYFLNWYFQDRLQIQEVFINAGERLNKIYFVEGKDHQLIASKLVKKISSKYKGYEMKIVKCYHVAELSGVPLKSELNKLGNFCEMEPGKIASRLELMVSPAAWSHNKCYPLQFQMEMDSFQEIIENGNDGCGYAPESFFVDWLGVNEGRTVSAIQVRIIAPRIGWFKGMLVKKCGIRKIQLPSSMKKVKASMNKTAPDWAFFMIHSLFPSAPCKMMGRYWNPHLKDPPKKYERNFKSMMYGQMYWSLLIQNGVPETTLEQYAQASEKWDGRNHCSVVGVADPTNTLPKNTVFLTGYGTIAGVQQEADSRTTLFVTRFPCTAKEDGLLLDCVQSKPRKMSTNNWTFLQTLPFGMLVFSSKGSIPERISDGDLDGDMYSVCWDDGIISHISEASSSQCARAVKNEDRNDPLIDTSFALELEDGKVGNAIVSRKQSKQEYVVNVGTRTMIMTKEEILRDRDYVEEIVAHRGSGVSTEVQLKWASGDTQWSKLPSMQWQIPCVLAEYARQHNLLHSTGWTWAKRHVRESEITGIEGHKKKEKAGKIVLVLVAWDDGLRSWEPIDDIKAVAMDFLSAYAADNSLENTKGWIWVKKYLKEKRSSWFERTQDYMTNIELLRDQDRLTTALHSAFKKSQEEGDNEENTHNFGQAFKNSIDIRKHGGKVDLPFELHSYIREKSLHKYFW